MSELEDLYGPLDEKKKKKRKKKKRKGGKKDGKGASKKGYTLRDWFKGGGWVQTGGKYDGKPCAKQPGQKTKPYCRDPDDRAKMSKKERDKRAKKKRKEDPNPERRGKAKNVRQKKTKRKSRKNEVLYMNLEQIVQEELNAVMSENMSARELESTYVKLHQAHQAEKSKNPNAKQPQQMAVILQKLTKLSKQGRYHKNVQAALRKKLKSKQEGSNPEADEMELNIKNKSYMEQIVQEELEAVLDEKRKKKKKKKKKKKGKRDACYHKVKSRYKVWPSAYASGALVKCRKVGAKNWGNSKKESIMIGFQNELLESKYSPHDMYDPKSGKKHDAKKEKDHLDMAKKGFVHVDPKKIEQILRDEGGAAGMDPFLKEFGEEMKDEIIKALEEMPNVGQHKDGDYILDDGEDVKISEGMNCGCGQDPCRTYGKNNSKIIAIVNEEIENYLEESLYYGLIDEDQAEKEALLEKKKKKACKPRKGKKYAKRVGGKCKSYGAKGYKIAPGTSKGDSYCARSYGDMKSHGKDCSGKDRGTPLCLSRQKWKCSGKYSRKGK